MTVIHFRPALPTDALMQLANTSDEAGNDKT
jgi:hypothetical protein